MLLKDVSAQHINTIHRLVLLANALPDAVREVYQNKVGANILKFIGGSVEQQKNSLPVRVDAFKVLCRHADTLLPKQFRKQKKNRVFILMFSFLLDTFQVLFDWVRHVHTLLAKHCQ